MLFKKKYNVKSVFSRHYTMSLSSLHNKIDTNNVGVKHNSYHRRIQKLKNNLRIKNEQSNSLSHLSTPIQGNKSKTYEIISNFSM